MRVVVDNELCDGNGVCSGYLPEVFNLDEQFKAAVLQPWPPESLRSQLEMVVNQCPKAAIKLVDEPDTSATGVES